MVEQRKRLSMLRSYTPADVFTLANASCGTISIFLCLSYIADDRSQQLWAAFVLPIVALACDAVRSLSEGISSSPIVWDPATRRPVEIFTGSPMSFTSMREVEGIWPP